eukprot:357117-Chlamydomonas_euryale.AAC.3
MSFGGHRTRQEERYLAALRLLLRLHAQPRQQRTPRGHLQQQNVVAGEPGEGLSQLFDCAD